MLRLRELIAILQRHDPATGVAAAARWFDREFDRSPPRYAARAVREGRPLLSPRCQAQLGELAGIDARADLLRERRGIEKSDAHEAPRLKEESAHAADDLEGIVSPLQLELWTVKRDRTRRELEDRNVGEVGKRRPRSGDAWLIRCRCMARGPR